MAVARKVTGVPAQTLVPGVADTLIVGVTLVETFMVMLFEVTLATVAQAAFEVNMHVTTSPKDSEVELNKEELLPALEPFTFH